MIADKNAHRRASARVQWRDHDPTIIEAEQIHDGGASSGKLRQRDPTATHGQGEVSVEDSGEGDEHVHEDAISAFSETYSERRFMMEMTEIADDERASCVPEGEDRECDPDRKGPSVQIEEAPSRQGGEVPAFISIVRHSEGKVPGPH
jgi:hypothetical protein